MAAHGVPVMAVRAAYGLVRGATAFQGRALRDFEVHVRKVHSALTQARLTAS